MTYTTASDLLTRFGADEIAQRCDRGIPRLVTPDLLRTVIADGDLFGVPQDAVDRARLAVAALQRAVDDADSAINSYISGRYRLPLSTVPSVLQRIAGDLARYYLYDDQVTEQIKQRYDAGIKLLGEVSRGVVQLGADPVSGDQPASTAGAELVTGGRVWARGSSSGFL